VSAAERCPARKHLRIDCTPNGKQKRPSIAAQLQFHRPIAGRQFIHHYWAAFVWERAGLLLLLAPLATLSPGQHEAQVAISAPLSPSQSLASAPNTCCSISAARRPEKRAEEEEEVARGVHSSGQLRPKSAASPLRAALTLASVSISPRQSRAAKWPSGAIIKLRVAPPYRPSIGRGGQFVVALCTCFCACF